MRQTARGAYAIAASTQGSPPTSAWTRMVSSSTIHPTGNAADSRRSKETPRSAHLEREQHHGHVGEAGARFLRDAAAVHRHVEDPALAGSKRWLHAKLAQDRLGQLLRP